MNHKKNSRVGMNMKPRIPQRAVTSVDAVSATEGQYGGQIRGESALPEPVETGGRLEENPVQNLDSENLAIVPAVVDERSVVIGLPEGMTPETTFGDVRVSAPDSLEEMMGKPEPGTYGAVERGTGDHMTPGLATLVVDKASGAMGVFTPGADHDDRIDALLMTKLAYSDGALTVGQRSDGTFGLVVSIPEGMIEPIREQAASDGVTAEEWVSTRLLEYMESWWSAPKGR